MNGRQVLWILLIAGVGLYLWKSGKVSRVGTAPAPAAGPSAPGGTASGFAGEACLTALDQANRRVQEASSVFTRAPIDPAAFASESEGASSAISAANEKCSGGGSTAEQRSMEEARGALSEMRALLMDLSAALAGNGSAADAPRRQETINRHMDAARLALRG